MTKEVQSFKLQMEKISLIIKLLSLLAHFILQKDQPHSRQENVRMHAQEDFVEEKNYQLSHRTDSSASSVSSYSSQGASVELSFRDSGFPQQENEHLCSCCQTYLFLSTPRMLLLLTTFRVLVGVQLLFATVRKFLDSFHFGMNGISPTLEHRGQFSAPTQNFAFCFDR